jgi:hypothetical protein
VVAFIFQRPLRGLKTERRFFLTYVVGKQYARVER